MKCNQRKTINSFAAGSLKKLKCGRQAGNAIIM
jgi:hypothetical protein